MTAVCLYPMYISPSPRLCAAGPARSVCGMFVTRLVSSGRFDNEVRVRASLLPAHRLLALCYADYQLGDELQEALKEYDW